MLFFTYYFYRLKDDTEEYYKSKEKKKFERHTSPASLRKSQDKFDPSSGAPISHLPIIHDEKTSKQLEKENKQNNLPAEKKVNKRKVQEINELFIIKLVFDALNHVIELYLRTLNVNFRRIKVSFPRTK